MRNKILGCLVALVAAMLITGCESKDDKKSDASRKNASDARRRRHDRDAKSGR